MLDSCTSIFTSSLNFHFHITLFSELSRSNLLISLSGPSNDTKITHHLDCLEISDSVTRDPYTQTSSFTTSEETPCF